MWAIMREVVLYLVFVSFLYVVIYSNRDAHAFQQVDHLRKYFLNTRQTNFDYTKVCCPSERLSIVKHDLI